MKSNLFFCSMAACSLLASTPAVVEAMSYSLSKTESYQLIDALAQGGDVTESALNEIKAQPEDYPPYLLLLSSRALFQRGEKDEALFWYLAGLLRMQFDVNRCSDPAVAGAPATLATGCEEDLLPYLVERLEVDRGLVNRVISWDKSVPNRYDPRWISNLGLGNPQAQTLPENEWPDIAERTYSEFADLFDGSRSVAAISRWLKEGGNFPKNKGETARSFASLRF